MGYRSGPARDCPPSGSHRSRPGGPTWATDFGVLLQMHILARRWQRLAVIMERTSWQRSSPCSASLRWPAPALCSSRHRGRRGIVVEGTVAANKISHTAPNFGPDLGDQRRLRAPMAAPVVQYRHRNGQTHHVMSTLSNSRLPPVGSTMRVSYRPHGSRQGCRADAEHGRGAVVVPHRRPGLCIAAVIARHSTVYLHPNRRASRRPSPQRPGPSPLASATGPSVTGDWMLFSRCGAGW